MSDEKEAKKDSDIINPDPYCPVRLTRINIRGKPTDKFTIELQKPDCEEWVDVPGVSAVHSSNYRLVTNAQVRDMAQEVFRQTGMQFERVPSWGQGHSRGLFWNGKHYLERWYTPDVRIDTPQGSQVMLGIEVRNSYDNACKVGLAFFAMHCACSNQFYGRSLFGDPLTFSHIRESGDLTDDISDALDQLRGQAQSFGKIAPVITKLNNTSFGGMEEFLALRNRMMDATGLDFRDKQMLDEMSGHGITKKVGIDIKGHYGAPDRYWALANAFTAITTHSVGGLRGHEQAARAVDFLIDDAVKYGHEIKKAA